MKIIYYSPHPNIGLNDLSGYGTHMREVIKGFENLGHEVHPLIMGGAGGNSSTGDIQFKESKFKTLMRKLTPKKIWETLKDRNLHKFDHFAEKELEKLVSELHPDLIYERGYYLMSSGAKVADKFDLKYYIEYNAPYLEERNYFGGDSFYLNKAQKSEDFNCNVATKIIVVTSALKKFYSDKYQFNENKIIVTPNAINPDTFLHEECIKKHEDGLDNIVIGFVGSIFPYHKVDRIIKAISGLLEKGQNVKGIIVGGGEILPDLRALAQKLNCQDNILFTGNVKSDEVPHYIDQMDIAVVPNAKWYMSPVKLFEYGIMGKAVIAPDSSSVEDVLINNENAILFTDESDFYLKLEKMVMDSKLREQISVKLKDDVLNKHTWDEMAKKILS